MKKIFTLAAALLASLSLTWAQTTYSLITGDGSLNSDEFFGGEAPLTDGNMTFEEVAYTNYIKFGSTASAPAYAANKTVGYHCKSAATDVKIYATNTNSSNKNLYITTFDEAAAAFVSETIAIAKNEAKVITKSYTNTTNKTIYLHVSSTDVKIYKFDVTETGAALKQAGEVGYSLNFNKGRFCAPASTEKVSSIDGLSFFGISSNYTPNNSSELQLKSVYAEEAYTTLAYVSFTAKEACQLHIKDNNGKGYWVSETLEAGTAEDLIINKDATINITAGNWYIISSNKGAIKFNLIEFTAPDLTPALDVDKESVDLKVTPVQAEASAKVKFTGRNLTPGTYNLTIPNLAGLTVTPTSVTVGEDGKLNAEVTIAYTSSVDIAAASVNISLTIGELNKTVAVNYSAVMTKNYINASVNIEGGIVAEGLSFATVAALEAANWEIAQVDANDSLNNAKGNARNESYLGLKLNKSTAAYLAGWVRQGDVLRVKFGNIPTAVLVSLNNGEATEYTAAVYELTASEDTYVKFAPKATGTKLVLKQAMLNEAIANVMYPITYEIGENGSVTGWTIAYPNEEVVMNITSNEGYALHSITYNSIPMVQSAPGAPISFIMPAEAVTVAADFGDILTAIDNADADVKAVKVVRNGQLFIEKNGVLYNAQGAVVK